MSLLVPPCALLALLLTAPAPTAPAPDAQLHAEVLRRLDSPEEPPP